MVAMRRRRGRSSGSAKTAPGTSPASGAAGTEPGRDLTVIAVPFYFATMAGEYFWLRRRAAREGPTAGDYERRDTLASLAMGVGSLLAPLVGPKLLAPFTPGRGRYGKAVVVGALGAAAATTVADVVTRRMADQDADQDAGSSRWRSTAPRAPPVTAHGTTRAVTHEPTGAGPLASHGGCRRWAG